MWVEGPDLEDLKQTGKARMRGSTWDVLVCWAENQVFAIENLCSHALVPLHTGRLRNYVITCSSHLAQFDVRDGSVIRGPLEGDPENIRQQVTYHVEVKNGRVYVEVPE
ncbi:MAG: Rieske 2Fe-2S domain-containing protein [Chloroflexi bacterium]|nr:Rieske 2Fe-2S domain-containing protein [Chloroflexota bacterium]